MSEFDKGPESNCRKLPMSNRRSSAPWSVRPYTGAAFLNEQPDGIRELDLAALAGAGALDRLENGRGKYIPRGDGEIAWRFLERRLFDHVGHAETSSPSPIHCGLANAIVVDFRGRDRLQRQSRPRPALSTKQRVIRRTTSLWALTPMIESPSATTNGWLTDKRLCTQGRHVPGRAVGVGACKNTGPGRVRTRIPPASLPCLSRGASGSIRRSGQSGSRSTPCRDR